MSSSDAVYYKFKNMSASALVQEGHTKLGSIFCASSTSGTAKVWNNTEASGDVCVDTFTLVAGTSYQIPADMKNGCYITIANTANITVFYQ